MQKQLIDRPPICANTKYYKRILIIDVGIVKYFFKEYLLNYKKD